jgi:glycosyltransferase involved in cell wall biosynthesis
VNSSNLDSVLVIVPVLNEEATIAAVIQRLDSCGLKHIRVVDNGSGDRTSELAKDAGATVLFEPSAGYGRACWRGLHHMPEAVEWVLFCDGDGSDDLSSLPQFFEERDRFDLILGNRMATATGRSAMTPVQRFGNRLATTLMWLGWGFRYQDLGPLRLIRRSALERINMQDRGFGWTVEMQVRAIECGLNICELPVPYHPRQGGKSKISGTLRGSIKAGRIILSTLGSLYWKRLARFKT